MTDTTGALPPAGWYPDPYGAPFERWWDGTGWTTHTNIPETAASQPAATPAAQEPEPFAAPVQAAPVQADPFAPFASAGHDATPQAVPYAQPVTQEPAYQQPTFEQPGFEQPVYQPPAFEQPAYQPPVFEQPVYQPPAFEQPAYQPPTTGQPAYQPPTTGQPAFQPPTTGQPAYEPPTFGQPVFDPPQPDAPVYAASQTTEPAYEAPAANPNPEIPYQPPAEQPAEPAPARESFQQEAFAQPVQYQAPAANQPQPAHGGMPNPPSSFDFGFGTGGATATGTPSNASIPGESESGFFGSWEPNEYVEPPSNRAASAGLVLGILSFFLSAVAGLIGLILSVVGLARASALARGGSGPVGRGKAIAGIILSIVGSAASTAAILYGLQFFAAQLVAATEDPGTDQTINDGAVLTQNGGIPLAVGDTGTIPLPDSESPAISFVVTAITPAFECTAAEEGVVSPENGQFIAVAMDVTLDANYLTAMDSGAQLRMNQSDWIGYSADTAVGQVNNTDGGISCIPEAEQFPDELASGTTTSAVIVLDMSTDTTALSWAPSGVTNLDPGITRWEWPVAS